MGQCETFPGSKMRLKNHVLCNRYTIEKKLGEGGMAEVFLAFDQKKQTQVAVKIMATEAVKDPTLVARFKREFDVCASLEHPNIIRLFNCERDESNAKWFYTMEYLPCKDLSYVLREEKMLSPEKTIDIGLQIARGFEEFHNKGVIHRDLKPANIMLTKEGRVVITDFGLVHTPQMTQLTQTGTIMGTPRYMSPELLQGMNSDNRSDIYQLGIILYECVTGHKAFTGETVVDIAMNVIASRYIPATKRNRTLAPQWDTFFSKTLAKDPNLRCSSATSVTRELLRLDPAKCPSSHKNSTSRKGAKSRKTTKPWKDDRLRVKKTHPQESHNSKQHHTPVTMPVNTPVTTPENGGNTGKTYSERKVVIVLFLSLFVGALTLMYVHGLPGKNATKGMVKSLRVYGGRESALIIWTSTTREKPPVFQIQPANGQAFHNTSVATNTSFLPVPVKNLPVKRPSPSDSASSYIHTSIVTRLKSRNHYLLIAGNTPADTVKRTFSTNTKLPVEEYSFNSRGELLISIAGDVPFTIGGIGNGLKIDGTTVHPASDYYLEATIVASAKAMNSEEPISLNIETLDGQIIHYHKPLDQLLGDYLKSIYMLFIDERNLNADTGESRFFTMWAKGSASNKLFEDFAEDYVASLSKTRRTELEKTLWEMVHSTLTSESKWYEKLYPLTKTIHYALLNETVSENLKQQLAFALTPLELLQGTAVSYGLPQNGNWQIFTDPQTRPFKVTDTPLRGPSVKHIEGVHSNWYLKTRPALPCYFLHDGLMPLLHNEIYTSPVRSFLTCHTLTFEIQDSPATQREAQVGLHLMGTGNPSKVVFLDVNNGKFTATIRPRFSDFKRLRNQWTKKGNYSNMIVLALTEHKHLLVGTGTEKRPAKIYGESHG